MMSPFPEAFHTFQILVSSVSSKSGITEILNMLIVLKVMHISSMLKF